MAESAVGFLLQTLGSLVQQEASLLQGLHSNFDEIQRKLQFMRSFLKDADRRKDSEDGVRTWVKQVRDATYEVEDIIDKYMYYIAKQHKGGALLREVLNNIIFLPKRYCYKLQIAKELQAITSKIQNISDQSKTYSFLAEGSTSETKDNGKNWQRSGEYASFIPDDEIVGIDKNKDSLIRLLKDESPERVVLSVVGMGGVGKTTLVTKVYNNPEVKKHFNCHAWITVSQSWEVDKLLRSMINEFYKSNKEVVPDGVGKMETGDLVEMVKDYLQEKRYVIVLDDVWVANVWRDIQVALPNNGHGGRIMLTTRMVDVASSFGVENVLHLQPLDYDDAWVLFCRRAFSNKCCPPELKPYAESLVQKCKGLPLAIVTIGGLMSMKEKSSLEWKKIENSLSWQLSNNKEFGRMKNILLLSYNDLPYNLKHCFLYCSHFPEDYQIRQTRLIRLWVAEGFIEEQRGLTLEEVAADYINELIYRSLLQGVKDDTFRPRKYVRMHDVLRKLALAIGYEESFCNVYDGKEETQKNEAHHFLMHNSIVNIQSSTCHLRSLMLFTIEIRPHSLRNIASNVNLVRVLDLRNSSIESVPDELVELFNLRYLCLKNTNIEELPKSVGRLRNLQTLDIRHSKIKTFPRGVERLKKLRHLFTYCRTRSKGFHSFDIAQFPDGICNLKCLQTLSCVGANDDIVRNLGNLTELRVLGIARVRRSHGVELCASIQKMRSLLELFIKATTEEEILDLDALSHPPALLQAVYLCGRFESLPCWIRSLQELTAVELYWSQLNEDPLSSLQALPNLVILGLEKAYVGKELCIRSGSFSKLKSLHLIDLPELNRMKIEKESMNCIENLWFLNCPKLKSIPEGIHCCPIYSVQLFLTVNNGNENQNLLTEVTKSEPCDLHSFLKTEFERNDECSVVKFGVTPELVGGSFTFCKLYS